MLGKLKLAFGDKELDKLFSNPMDSRAAVEDELSYNLNRIGSGGYSSVFEYKDRVIKLGIYRDVCWYHFGEYAMKHNNKHYPRIYRLEAFPDQEYFIAEMELLKPLKKSDVDKLWLKYPGISTIMGNTSYDIKTTIKETSEVFPNDDVIKALIPFIDKRGCGFDLHKGNFMWRGDTLVISDPISPN